MEQTVCPNCGGFPQAESHGWKCKKCRGFISLQDGKFYEYVEKPFLPPMTNADRIRAMSDEELAEFIRDVSYECQDASWGCHCQTCSYPWCSSDQTAEWLKQPAEE